MRLRSLQCSADNLAAGRGELRQYLQARPAGQRWLWRIRDQSEHGQHPRAHAPGHCGCDRVSLRADG